MVRVPFGDIAYGTSEWFWMPGTADSPGHLDDAFRVILRNWEGCTCPRALLSLSWRDRVVQNRRQASLPEPLGGEPRPLEEHIVAAAERLQDEIAKMPRQSARKFARALCVKRNKKATVQDELQKLQETIKKLEDEAKQETLNLAGYRFHSRLTVFAYWCCERRQRQTKASAMARFVEPIAEENGLCLAQVFLDEAEGQLRLTQKTFRQLRRLHKHIDEDFMSPYRDRILMALAASQRGV